MTKQIISGVLLLNKPSGMTSHTALSRAKHLFKSPTTDSKKAGHTGTLDPMATGLLPLCFGVATKFSSFGLDADKSYEAVIRLGVQTDTGDKEGQIVKQTNISTFCQNDLDMIASDMQGEQHQIPPMYSALKKDGKKLYEYAREGIHIERSARPIVIHKLRLQKLSEDSIALSVRCSKGTYVRVLAEDIAFRLHTLGHLTALHRTATGGFQLTNSVTLEQLQAMSFADRLSQLLPIDVMVSHLPILSLDEHQAKRVNVGQRLNVKNELTDIVLGEARQVRLYHQDKFLGLAMLEASGRLQPIKMVGI